MPELQYKSITTWTRPTQRALDAEIALLEHTVAQLQAAYAVEQGEREANAPVPTIDVKQLVDQEERALAVIDEILQEDRLDAERDRRADNARQDREAREVAAEFDAPMSEGEG